MKRAKTSLRELLGDITPEERAESRLSFQISNRLDFLMQEKGLSKKQLADALGKRSDIRQAFPGLTNDDCVFCTMNFMGCSKEFISHAMGSSEEALRRRKSRIKQKLPEDLFHFFFSK